MFKNRLAILLCFTLLTLCMDVRAEVVRGKVNDQTGAAIEGAHVRLTIGNRLFSTTTDSTGLFHLDVPDSAGTLTITARGFAILTVPWRGSSSELQFTLQPAPVTQEIVVTADRGKTPITDTAANVISLSTEELNTRAAATLDDALRQAPGFTLFRRNGSLVANPTTQGGSLRGVGASGASRVLVLEDGIPLNDPFGGWVYWDRTPRIAFERAELLRGGGASLYGNSAFAGVVDLLTAEPTNLIALESSGDSLSGHDVQGALSHRFSQWKLYGTGESYGNDGAFIVARENRGLIDTPAALQFGNASANVERSWGTGRRAFVSGSIFSEQRNNGTALQVNSTHLGEAIAGLDAEGKTGLVSLRFYGTGEHYHQSFSSVAPDRNSESLVRWQTVPSDQLGFSAQWARTFSGIRVTAGTDGRYIHGETDETVFSSGAATSLVNAGGTNENTGIFGEISGSLLHRLRLSAGVRGDWLQNTNGFTRTTPVSTGVTTGRNLPSRNEQAVSPRSGLVYDLAGGLQITASAYGGFRAPTLNELYRSFRLGNVVTVANEQLLAEHLAGGEAGLRYARNRFILSGSYFHQHVDDPIANITLSSTPLLITRQRQNMGALVAQGVDADALVVLPRMQLRAGYEYAHSEVTSFSADRTLVGNIVPQVPAHVFTFTAIYNAPRCWNIEWLLRASSRQFDDDQNLLVLDGYSTVGVSVSRSVGPTTWFVAASNIFNTSIEAAATPLKTFAAPRVVSGGVRLRYGGL